MIDLQFVKGLFSKKNIYFIASFAVLVAATVYLLFLLNGQSEQNLQAKLILDKSKDFAEEIAKNDQKIKNAKIKLMALPPVDDFLADENDINELTRYLDNIFAGLNDSGLFLNSSLSFGEVNNEDGMKYVDASLSLKSSLNSFFDFLEFVKNTGISENDADLLMEIRSISITLTEVQPEEENEEETEPELNHNVTLRIYLKPTIKNE